MGLPPSWAQHSSARLGSAWLSSAAAPAPAHLQAGLAQQAVDMHAWVPLGRQRPHLCALVHCCVHEQARHQRLLQADDLPGGGGGAQGGSGGVAGREARGAAGGRPRPGHAGAQVSGSAAGSMCGTRRCVHSAPQGATPGARCEPERHPPAAGLCWHAQRAQPPQQLCAHARCAQQRRVPQAVPCAPRARAPPLRRTHPYRRRPPARRLLYGSRVWRQGVKAYGAWAAPARLRNCATAQLAILSPAPTTIPRPLPRSARGFAGSGRSLHAQQHYWRAAPRPRRAAAGAGAFRILRRQPNARWELPPPRPTGAGHRPRPVSWGLALPVHLPAQRPRPPCTARPSHPSRLRCTTATQTTSGSCTVRRRPLISQQRTQSCSRSRSRSR